MGTLGCGLRALLTRQGRLLRRILQEYCLLLDGGCGLTHMRMRTTSMTRKRSGLTFTFPAFSPQAALVMMNLVAPSQLSSSGSSMFESGTADRARIFFLIALIISFAGVIGGFWIMAANYAADSDKVKTTWPGAAIVLQQLCILAGALTFFFGRDEGEDVGGL